jgi:hypothetical protein
LSDFLNWIGHPVRPMSHRGTTFDLNQSRIDITARGTPVAMAAAVQ